MCRPAQSPFEQIESAVGALPGWLAQRAGSELGVAVIQGRALIDRLEAVNAEATRRFEKSGAYKADGALGIVPWLREKTGLSGGSAAEHVEVARQLEQLPQTEEALARGEIGYQHAVAMAFSAKHIGPAAVRKAEASLLRAAETMDAGQFTGVVKDFEHRADSDAALTESNRAYQRRWLQIGEPINGLARIEGQLVAEAAASLRTAMEPFMKPRKGDERSAGQRAHDALAELARRAGRGHANGADSGNGAGPRPQLIVTTSVDTLAGIAGAPAGQLQWGGTIPAETVRRMGCDAAITRITGIGELEHEITHASRTTPPSMRRAMVARDGHCIFPGCDRPPPWCDAHHLKFWADSGPTKLENLGLVCGEHHRKVHEEGWTLERKDGRWVAKPPPLKIAPHARSA